VDEQKLGMEQAADEPVVATSNTSRGMDAVGLQMRAVASLSHRRDASVSEMVARAERLRKRRTASLWTHVVMVWGFASVIAAVQAGAVGPWAAGVYAVLWLAVIGVLGYSSLVLRVTALRLAREGDPRAVGALIDGLFPVTERKTVLGARLRAFAVRRRRWLAERILRRFGIGSHRRALESGLARSLDAASEEELSGLNGGRRHRLRQLALIAEDRSLALAVLDALRRSEDSSARPFVDPVAKGGGSWGFDAEVRGAAEQCLAALDAAHRRSMLLRPAVATSAPEELLRPASAASSRDEEALLRASAEGGEGER